MFEVAVEAGRLDLFYEEVKEILGVLADNEDLSKLMTHPKIVKKKIKIIEEIFAGKVSDEIVGLMRMIVARIILVR